MKYLFVSPHPDDIELGCSATIFQLLKNKCEVQHLVVADCSDLPRNRNIYNEYLEAHRVLGIPDSNSKYLGLPNRRLYDTSNREILRAELEEYRARGIEAVFCPWLNDINQDHSTVAEECVRVFRYSSVFQYEVVHSCPGFEPNVFVAVTPEAYAKKMAVMEIYESQRQMLYTAESSIATTLRFRGTQAGIDMAEGFILFREVIHL